MNLHLLCEVAQHYYKPLWARELSISSGEFPRRPPISGNPLNKFECELEWYPASPIFTAARLDGWRVRFLCAKSLDVALRREG